MAKKIFWAIIFALIFVLVFTTISFAKTDNTTTTLGNEVTSSINETERNMNDLVDRTNLDKAGQTIENGARAVGNAVSEGMDNIRRGADDLVDGNDNDGMNNDRTDNRAVAGTTGNYTAAQTGDATGTTRNGMTQNAWIWIVMVVVALIIVAAVWYYAAQKQ